MFVSSAFRLAGLVLLASLSLLPALAQSSRPNLCSITGTVKDANGLPLAGAVISVFLDKKTSSVLQIAQTDATGRFSIANLFPGLYRLRIVANGYEPVYAVQAQATPNRQAVLNVALRRIFPSAAAGIDPVKYQARRNRGIFQAAPTANTLSAAISSHGIVRWIAQSSPGLGGIGAGSTFEEVSTLHLSDSIRLSTAIQSDHLASGTRFADLQLSGTFSRHQPSLGLQYTRRATIRDRTFLDNLVVRATDSWKAADDLQIVYGLEVSHLENTSSTTVRPRIGVFWNPSPANQVYAAVSPDGRLTPTSPEELEVSSSNFPNVDAFSAVADDTEHPLNPASLRYEAGLTHRLDAGSLVDIGYFHDRQINQGISFVGGSQQIALIPALNGVNQGIRIVYRKRINTSLEVSTGYTFGTGSRLGTNDENPEITSSKTIYHIINTRVDTFLPFAGTIASLLYRREVGNPVFAIDPFQDKLLNTLPGLGLSINQPLPESRFLPGKWEITVEARNLLDRHQTLESNQGTLFRPTTRRLVRGGVAMRF